MALGKNRMGRGNDILADIQKQCVDCPNKFWWTVEDQEFFADQGYAPPKRCDECRRKKKARRTASESSPALVPVNRPPRGPLVPRRVAQQPKRELPAIPTALVDPAALFSDIQHLLDQATAPIHARSQTWWEWIRNIDPNAEQLARKLAAGHYADQFVQQRTAVFTHIQQMIDAATNAELIRMQAEIRLQEAELRRMELQEAIDERQALADVRLHNKRLREHLDQQRLLASAPQTVDAETEVVEEHRRHRRAHASAGQELISDFIGEIDRICRRKTAVHEKALRIREVLRAFERDEDALPEKARRILKRAEELNDVG